MGYCQEAGYPNGVDLEMITFRYGTMPDVMQAVAGVLAESNIRLKLKPMAYAQYFNMAYRFRYQTALHMSQIGNDPSEWLVPYFGTPEAATYFKWNNKELHKLIEEQEYIMDKEKRVKVVHDIQRKVMDEGIHQAIFTTGAYVAVMPYVHIPVYEHQASTFLYEKVWMEKH